VNTSPINSKEINGDSRAGVHLEASESISLADADLYKLVFAMADTLQLVDAQVLKYTWGAAELMDLADSVSASARMQMSATEEVTIDDAALFIQKFIAGESVLLGDTPTDTTARLLAVVEMLQLSGVATSRAHATVIVAESILMADAARVGPMLRALEDIGITDTADLTLAGVIRVLESILIEDTATPSFTVRLVATEDVEIADADSLGSVIHLLATESIVFGGTLTLDDQTYDAWVLNTDTEGVFQYNNYNFNGFTEYQGEYYATNETGLYKLGGDTDDGSPIEAHLRTGLVNNGTSLLKKTDVAYLGYTSDGELLLKVEGTYGGEKEERWYKLQQRTADAPREARVDLKRWPWVKSVYWDYEVRNINGADFDIDNLEFVQVLLSRRV